jgi:hypothetical protein
VSRRDGVAGLLSKRMSCQSDGLVMAVSAWSRAFWVSLSFSTIRLLTVSTLGYRMMAFQPHRMCTGDWQEDDRTLTHINVVDSRGSQFNEQQNED